MQISLHTVIPVVWNSWLKALSGLNVAALNISETHFRNRYVTTSHGQCEFEFRCANFITGKVGVLFSHRLKVDFLDPIMPLEIRLTHHRLNETEWFTSMEVKGEATQLYTLYVVY